MNKKAQVNPFLLVFYIILFFLVMGAGLGYFVNTGIGVALTNGSLSGFEAFIVSNLILWIILIFIVAVLWWTR